MIVKWVFCCFLGGFFVWFFFNDLDLTYFSNAGNIPIPQRASLLQPVNQKLFTVWEVRHWHRLPTEPGSVQGHTGWGFEQPGLWKGSLPMAAGFGTR